MGSFYHCLARGQHIQLSLNMRAFITILAVLPLALANTGSFVKISGHGQSYSYNHGDHAVFTAHPAPAHPVAHPAPHPAPAPYKPAPTPVYKPAPAPVYKPAPVYHPKPAPVYHPKPAPYHPAPVHHAPIHHAPHHGHGYGYAPPKENCSVSYVTETAETCTPTIETVCEDIELPIKIIVDVEQCDQITRTVCTESITVIPQEVCVYEYVKKYEETVAKTVEVNYVKETNVQMVTVCSGAHRGYGHHAPVHHAPIHHAPHHGFHNHGAHLGHPPHFVGKREAEAEASAEAEADAQRPERDAQGYGYGGYGKYCQEVAQETAYNVPVPAPVDIPVKVSYPLPQKVCVDKPILLPVVTCDDIISTKCIQVPTVVDSSVKVASCKAQLGAPACSNHELSLPKQRCIALVYGHAEHVAPGYHHKAL